MSDTTLARLALALVWLGTAVVSLHDGGLAGAALLRGSGLSHGQALAAVWLGSAWDAALGIALLMRPRSLVYRIAALGVLAMTLIATLVLPGLWLDPFGPLLKNLPLLALLRLLTKEVRA
jgi:hypothetical protein